MTKSGVGTQRQQLEALADVFFMQVQGSGRIKLPVMTRRPCAHVCFPGEGS
jgi:hypothetical protein